MWIQIRSHLIGSTRFALIYISHICSRQRKQMTFSRTPFPVLKGVTLQQEVGLNRSVSLCNLTDKVEQLNE